MSSLLLPMQEKPPSLRPWSSRDIVSTGTIFNHVLEYLVEIDVRHQTLPVLSNQPVDREYVSFSHFTTHSQFTIQKRTI